MIFYYSSENVGNVLIIPVLFARSLRYDNKKPKAHSCYLRSVWMTSTLLMVTRNMWSWSLVCLLETCSTGISLTDFGTFLRSYVFVGFVCMLSCRKCTPSAWHDIQRWSLVHIKIAFAQYHYLFSFSKDASSGFDEAKSKLQGNLAKCTKFLPL